MHYNINRYIEELPRDIEGSNTFFKTFGCIKKNNQDIEGRAATHSLKHSLGHDLAWQREQTKKNVGKRAENNRN